MARKYRTKDPLRLLVLDIIRGIYRSGIPQEPDYDTIERLLEQHPRFYRCGGRSRKVKRYGLAGVIRPVLRGVRFIGGPYTGVRAVHPIPARGRRQGILRFADRMERPAWQEIINRHQATNRSSQIKRDEAQHIYDDLTARGVETLQQAYGQMALGL